MDKMEGDWGRDPTAEELLEMEKNFPSLRRAEVPLSRMHVDIVGMDPA